MVTPVKKQMSEEIELIIYLGIKIKAIKTRLEYIIVLFTTKNNQDEFLN